MLRCIEYGCHIPCFHASIVLLYPVSGNYPAVALYGDHVSKEIEKMCATKVLYPVHSSSVKFYTPINAVIKNSDKNHARTIANIHITDQASLTRASDILMVADISKMKIRVTTDHTAICLNSCSYSPVFSYSTIADATLHARRRHWSVLSFLSDRSGWSASSVRCILDVLEFGILRVPIIQVHSAQSIIDGSCTLMTHI